MSCSKCDIAEKAKKNAKLNKTNMNSDLVGRIVFEQLKRLESVSNAPVKRRETIKKNSLVGMDLAEMLLDSADKSLIIYEQAYRDELSLKLVPMHNISELNAIQEKIYNATDMKWRAENSYKRLSNATDPEDELLKIRIKVRSEILKPVESSQQNEDYNMDDDILAKLLGKDKKEQLAILKKEMPDIPADILQDVLDSV